MVKRHNKTSKNKISEQKTTWLLISVAVVVLVLIIGGYVLFGPSKSTNRSLDKYNSFSFEHKGNQWVTMVERNGQVYETPFNYHPTELSGVKYDPAVTKYMLHIPHRTFTIAVRPDAGSQPVLGGVNIARITGKFYGVPTDSALYVEPEFRNITDTGKLPVASCADATRDHVLIWISKNETESVVKFDKDYQNCIIVGGSTNEEILKSADTLVYKILGIMN